MDKYKFAQVVLLLLVCGCMKLNQPAPASTQLQTPTVFSGDMEAETALAGMYTEMMTHNRYIFNGGLSLYAGLSSGELIFNKPPLDTSEYGFADHDISPNNPLCSGNLYGAAYTYIGTANAILRGLSASMGVSVAEKTRLQGQAEFTRALCYFYLVNLFGRVPLVTGTDHTQNAVLPRSNTDDVYTQIINDLKDAQNLIPEIYEGSLTNSNERIFPNRDAATALLARVYLYRGDWNDAIAQAGAVIADSALYRLENVDTVFLAGSREAIWQLQPVTKFYNTSEGNIFLPSFGVPVYGLDTALLNTFEAGDLRRSRWVGKTTTGYYYPHKYKVPSGGPPYKEYNVVLRLAELYLIRAEAYAELGDPSGAAADLNIIRARAGLLPTTASDIPSLIAAINRERRVEFFAEWGHRWFDLKRSGSIDSVMQGSAGWAVDGHDTLYPIPASEIILNPALVQNPGYVR